jgi:hypothetical protein
MKSNDITFLVLVFCLGLLLGVISTLIVYGPISSRQADLARLEAEASLKRAEEERDEALGRVNDYLLAEQHRQLDAEMPRNDQLAPSKGPQVAVTPPAQPGTPSKQTAPDDRREAAPDTTQPAKPTGFGPPRQYGKD